MAGPLATINTTKFQRKLDSIRKDARAAEVESVLSATHPVIDALQFISPRDTNRYVRAWMMAGNHTGAGRWPVPEVRASRTSALQAARLEQQLYRYTAFRKEAEESALFWERMWQTRYENTKRNDIWQRDCLTKKRKADKRLAKLDELVKRLEKTLKDYKETDIVIWGSHKAANQNILLKRNLHTIRGKVYGGEGFVLRPGNGRVLVRIRNKEPHAYIVEKSKKNGRCLARALAFGRAKARSVVRNRFVSRVRRRAA